MRSSSPPRALPAQYGVIAPFPSTTSSRRRGIDATAFRSASARRLFTHEMAFRTRPRNAFSRSKPFGAVAANRASTSAQTFSIGFKSGEYGGSVAHGTPTLPYAAFGAGPCRALSPS